MQVCVCAGVCVCRCVCVICLQVTVLDDVTNFSPHSQGVVDMLFPCVRARIRRTMDLSLCGVPEISSKGFQIFRRSSMKGCLCQIR